MMVYIYIIMKPHPVYLSVQKTPKFKEVSKEWLDHKKLNIRASTWSVYEGHTRNHFNEFKDLPINKITTQQIENFIHSRQVLGMNIATLRKIIVSLNQIFQLAVRRRYIHINPLDNAERPRDKGDIERSSDRISDPDKRINGWNLVFSGGYFRLFRKVNGNMEAIYLGKKFDREVAETKIREKEKAIGLDV